MKSLVNNRQCAHAWAHQHQSEGRGSNFFFVGSTIYSYGHHFPIATIDGDIVYFTTKNYSNTTAHHKALARNAVSHKRIIFLPVVPEHRSPASNQYFQSANLDHWMGSIEADLKELNLNPRKRSLVHAIHSAIRSIQEFIEVLGIQPPKKVQNLLVDTRIETLTSSFELEQQRKLAREKRRERTARRNQLLALRKWECHETDRLPGTTALGYSSNLAYLRISQDETMIETSKGVQIRIEAARRFFRYIQNILPLGCDSCQYQIQQFKVDSIQPQGITVGCHYIPMDQVNNIAMLMRWI
jgi:hypothetical protein